ncbi:MAG TPA: ABC-F family ATP-binding cassette domain-containing protein [Candidatus Cloacimonas acidaminovorans]|nr:ABC-F family ATP-binding cassette domain-containing protein [Candidatus Cloacimonas acidaminovorans]HRS60418.1 ABC-F family ATP-binding cassette domain-containing protein [Candidatus Cloacimonas sp.]HOM79032.1 ABC-F family ATP-binding cassette domain-containing protein [Candidatus Cloacimonas acidaminovorans]HOS06885.1 ABC-F family ATP-binding cassette domain-containing protein [Candidatus Cloacimonas acidaminovorans]HOT38696.1 ABC-F family ATP-binding cassette domain-containing protein [Can
MNEVLLTLEDVSCLYGERIILQGVSFGIHSSEKIGIVGINGSGKTTLLRIISGLIKPNTGTVTMRKDLKVCLLEQDPVYISELSVLQHTFPVAGEIKDEYHYKSILSRLGINNFDEKMGNLSGGQRRKADLARVLAAEPDLLLLDEPTNHLDLETIEWLQNYLANAGKAVIFVTHDRYFLDAVATKIIEIERTKLFYYEGNYSAYIRGKLIRATDNKRKETRRQAQLKKELDWLNRGAKARTSKPKDHIDRVKELLSKSYLISHQDLDISFQIDRLGKTILELHRLSKSYSGKVLFTDIDHNFQNMERIGIIGPNGCGKTTLLKIILGEEKPDNGTVKIGVNTHFAYYKQDEDSFDPNLTVYEYIAQFAEVIKTAEGNKVTATEMLKRFLFDGKMQQMKLGALSGGERKRLYLLKALMFGANFIIMDEPTNDLDIRTLEILEDYLDAFKGCLLIVSHDRFFLDRTVDYLFIFQDGKLRKFAGNYSDYLLVKRFEQDATEEKKEPVITRPKRIAKGLSYNEQREFGLLEKEIEKIESELMELESRLNDFANPLSPNDYYHISISMQELENRHQELLTRWLELSDKQNAGN